MTPPLSATLPNISRAAATPPKIRTLLFANTDWYLYNFRRSLAAALRDAGHEVLLVSPPGEHGEKLEALGFRWLPAPMDRRSLNPFKELKLLAWLYALIRREGIDLVHGFTIKCAVYRALAARLSGRAAWVSAVAGMGYVFTSDDRRARLLRPVVRGLMRVALDGPRARLILRNPDDVALFERAQLVHANRLRLIKGPGVDCSRFTPMGDRLQKRDPFRVLLPARLLWDKGLAEYVEASRLLKAQGRAIEFLLAGDPDPGNPASVPEATVRQWANEGLPKGLIEVAASELPLVATDVPGCREVVTHGVVGLLVPPKDAAALAAAIARLHGNPHLRTRLTRAARAKALANFDERIVIDRTLDVYRELLPHFA